MKVVVAGTGYVGLSMATLLAQHHKVVAVDIMPEKGDKINKRISSIHDEYIDKYFVDGYTLCLLKKMRKVVGYVFKRYAE